jgi:sulfur carrier protein ThiS
MKVYIEKENKHLDAQASNGKELLKTLKINPSAIILVRNNEVILEDESLKEDDEIKILSVISGG